MAERIPLRFFVDAFGDSFAVFGQVHGFLDEVFRLLGGILGTHGQVAHFLGHHGEATARITGARRLDRRIQGQKIGLEGDLVDVFDDLRRALAGALDLAHGIEHLAHGHVALVRRHFGAIGEVFRFHRIFGALLRHRGHLFQGGGGFLQRGGLDAGAFGHGLAAAGDFTGRGVDLGDGVGHLGQGVVQCFAGAVDAIFDASQIAHVIALDTRRQVAFGQFIKNPGGLIDRPDDRVQGCR